MSEQKTVYVGGFSLETRAEAIQAAFTPFGDVVDIQLPPDPSQKNPHRGFAFVTFSTNESALDAIDNMHDNVLPGPGNVGRPLKVNLAKPPKGVQLGGSNRAIWTDEAWLKEHGANSIENARTGEDDEADQEAAA
ncbi:hypothetical protein OIV83_006377 [Microbotryomycetes sp. JL201]|nr:hypothetical protein OIV83_006377 [Microbotryomycetes sp. JL201]